MRRKPLLTNFLLILPLVFVEREESLSIHKLKKKHDANDGPPDGKHGSYNSVVNGKEEP